MTENELREKYGWRSDNGNWITDLQKYHYWAQRPEKRKWKRRRAYLWLLIPIVGIAGFVLAFDELGESWCR